MSNLKRYYSPGQTYFVTAVTFNRAPILWNHEPHLLNALHKHFSEPPTAWVIMPDHFHAILDPGDQNLSLIMRRVKLSFSAFYRVEHNLKKGRLWQLRFWDHVIRDEADMNRHIDYIHYNPVKHGIEKTPGEFAYSSFSKFFDKGMYDAEWGKMRLDFEGEFGE